jgi:ankyrin repeat protein
MLSLLIEHGADVSAVDAYGRTALLLLAGWGVDATASFTILLDHGAAIDQLSHDGSSSALHYAAGARNTKHVLFLLGRGANAALTDSNGLTALHKTAGRFGPAPVEIVTALLAHGASVDAVDGQGRTPLHHRVGHGMYGYTMDADVPAARKLLQAGANVNATDKNGDSPLILWARHNRQSTHEFAQLLIDHGADIAAHNNEGQRASDAASSDSSRAFLLAAEEAQRNNHRYKRPRPEDLQPRVEPAAEQEQEEEEDESDDDSDDEDEDEDD